MLLLECQEFVAYRCMPFFPGRDGTRCVTVFKTVTANMRHMHCITCLIESFGERLQFCWTALQSVDQQYRVFASIQM